MKLINKKCSTKVNKNITLQTAFKNTFFLNSEEKVQTVTAKLMIAPANSLSDRWNRIF